MNVSSLLARRIVPALLLVVAPLLAQAGYFQWDTVELPASSGASCGNGTPYRFFVNRHPFSRDTVVVYEGGGACWDQKSCLGQGKLSASNPNGIPSNYLSQFNTAAYGLVTPFSARLDPFQSVRTQGWTMVYLPYCTGDVHTGSLMTVYNDADPANPRVQFHRGQANVRGAAQWMRANMGRPAQLLLTGFSAGGVGSTATYPLMRDTLAPTGRASLLADSGPLFPAPRSSTPEKHPSLLLHNRIRAAWGLDAPGGLITQFASRPGFDTDDLGSITGALAKSYPADRFGYMVFELDGNFSSFSYQKFYTAISGAANEDARRAELYGRWFRDLTQWLPVIDSFANVAYHLPFYRPFNDSHCLTIVDFSGTGIEERGINDLSAFVDNTLDRGTPMRNVESDWVSDLSRPVSFALTLLSVVLGLFG